MSTAKRRWPGNESMLHLGYAAVCLALLAGCSEGSADDSAPDAGGTDATTDSAKPDASGTDAATHDGAADDASPGADAVADADTGADAGIDAAPIVGPCDIYGDGGTACVAAHSTTRALYGSYGGKLYQVTRASDQTTLDIGTLSAGGYANAAAQDAFCVNTTCTITIIYDQSPKANHLTISGGGTAVSSPDVGANAALLPAIAGGNKVYGVYVSPGTGYRNVSATGTAKNGQPEGMYMVTSGTHVNDGCCFDYGNTEQPAVRDPGNGHMDAVYFGNRCEHPPCTGSGPWIAADLENGLFQGNGSNTSNMPVAFDLVTAMLKNDGQTKFALKTGNAQVGALTSQYNGTLPTSGGYIPLSQEGGIVLGVGGDNSNWSAGDFYEGLMTYGYPTDAADDAVHANIVGVHYKSVTYTAIAATSETTPQAWKYTTGTPSGSWFQTSFDDSAWTSGNGGFGTAGTPGAIIGTTWSTGDIWMRRHFNAGALTAAQLRAVLLRLHHDEDLDVFVNGVQATSQPGYVTSYGYVPMAAAAQSALVPGGDNVIALHCHQTGGGQYVDVGVYLRSL